MPTSSTSTKKLNPFAEIYNPISPGVISTRNNTTTPPFPEIINQIIPQQTQIITPYFTSQQFYNCFSYMFIQQQQQPYDFPAPPQNNIYYGPKNTPPRLLARPREVVDGGVRVSGGRGKKEVGERNGRMWVPSRNERKVLGFGSEVEKRSRVVEHHEVMPLKWDEEKTSVMIKNIPYDCPRKELIKVLDDFCLNENRKDDEEIIAYDFLYLPVDFKTKKSRGFAFVNFTNAKGVRKFFDTWNMAAWESVHWRKWTKAIEIVTAKIQGKEALAGHFSGSLFECESDEFLPVTFNPARDGSVQKVKTTVVGNRRAFQRWAARKA